MLRAHRLPAVRLCLLFVSVVLCSATVSVLAASADPFGVVAPYHSHRKASSRASARRARCAAAARAGKHRKACAGKKSKAKPIKPSVSPKPAGMASPSVESPGTPALVIGGALPPEALKLEPVAPTPPVEPIAPVEEPKPPVEEPKPPVEEPKPPVEEPVPPVEESKAPVEAPPTGKASTTTTLASSVNPSIVWQPVTYTAKVSSTAATGTIAFEEAGTPIAGCTAQPVGSGAATCTHSGYTAAGAYLITATYSGDGNYLTSASSSSNQVVDKAGTTKTTTTLASSSNPSMVGEAVTFTATLDTTAATGTVEFKQAGVTISVCAARAVSSGTATCTVADLGAGSPWITAVYSGDSNYASSLFPGLTQTVNKKTTTTTVLSSLDPSTVGETVSYTATVSPAAATGTVSFDEAGKPIAGCAAQPIGTGTAMCTVANLAAGGYGITAVYSGDSNYAASWSSGLSQTVKKKTTTTTVSSSLDPSTASEAVTYKATVNTTAATGIVEFREAGTAIAGCAAQTVNSGSATCTVANPTAGSHWITAIYSGDNNYVTSTSAGITQVVNKKATTTTTSSSLNPSMTGQAVTYTATLNTTAATGIVEFKEEGTPITGCTAQTISSGTATCAVTGYPGWSWHIVTAAYSGDSNYAASASSTLTQTVEPPPVKEPLPAVDGQWYSSASAWNTPIPANPVIAPNNSSLIAAWAETTLCKGNCLHTQYDYTPAIWVADNATPLVTVQIDYPSCDARTVEVPIPADAIPDPSKEGHMAIMQEDSGVEYDFWKAQSPNQPSKYGCETASTWTAGKVVTTNWQTGSGSLYGSVRGSGTPEGAGTVRPRDTQMPAGSTWDHALAITYRNTCSASMSWCSNVAPATSEDGTCTGQATCVPEGARFQLEPSIDCNTWPSLQYEWQKQMCRTFQVYGGIIVDTNEGGPGIYDQWYGSLEEGYIWPWLQPGTSTAGLPNDLLSHFRVLAW